MKNNKLKNVAIMIALAIMITVAGILNITSVQAASVRNIRCKSGDNVISVGKFKINVGETKKCKVQTTKNKLSAKKIKWSTVNKKKSYSITYTRTKKIKVYRTKKGRFKIKGLKATREGKPAMITITSKRNPDVKCKIEVTVVKVEKKKSNKKPNNNVTDNNNKNNNTNATNTKPPVHYHKWVTTNKEETVTTGSFVRREIVGYEYMKVNRVWMSMYPYLELTSWQYEQRLEFDDYHHVYDIICWRIGADVRPAILDIHPEWANYASADSTFGGIAGENIPKVVYATYPERIVTTTYYQCSCGETDKNVKTSYTGTPTRTSESLEIPHMSQLDWLKRYDRTNGKIASIESNYANYGMPTCECDFCTTYQ